MVLIKLHAVCMNVLFLSSRQHEHSSPRSQTMQLSFPHVGKPQGQHIWSAMAKPRPGKTQVPSLPGKHECTFLM